MVPGEGFFPVHYIQGTGLIHEVFGHENHQNGLHAVKAEAFSGFVPYDIGYPPGIFVEGIGADL